MDHHWLCLVVMERSVCSMMSSHLTWMPNFQHGVKYQDLHLPCPGHGIVLAPLTIQNWWFQEGVRVLVCFSVALTFWMSQWKNLYGEIPASWTTPSRLGHALSVYNGRKILMFGGLAKSGPLRLGSSDVFTMDLSEEPCWRCITGSGMPDAGNPAGNGPPPRLDHVAVSLPGGRILIFGGSVAGLHSASQLYLLDPTEETPTWRCTECSWFSSICLEQEQ